MIVKHVSIRLCRAVPFALVFACAFPVHSTQADSTSFFPIMAWDGPPNDPAVFQKMRECGFTVAGFVPPAALGNCHAAGLKAIVSDARVGGYNWTNVDADAARQRVSELIGEVRNHPAVFGYYLRDEPTSSYFRGLAAVSDVVKELHPGAWPYVNLFPNYADAGQLGAPSYDDYVKKFIAECRPPILSYDHYAMFEGGGMRGEYFANLESVRRAAAKHDLPFQQIVLALACLNYRQPSDADMSFQVYTSLAYGARGIAYFKYFSPAVGNFRGAPIDPFGNEGPMWHTIQQLNLQIAKLAPTLLKLKSDRVYHFGKVPDGCTGPEDGSLVEDVAGSMLVGDFTHGDGSRYIMVVNKDLARSTTCHPKLRQPVARLELISAYSGTPMPYEGEQCWLAPGQGILLKLVPSN